jgi:hypothetical protein
MTIDQKTIAELLQLGGQYLLPIAALLRALYAGTRGKLPEGASQIALASLFAGLTAVADNQGQFNLTNVIAEVLGNTAFTAGLLAFIIVYLLRVANYGLIVDGIVGGGLGLIAWLGWVLILQNDLPWWTIPIAIAGGAAGFIVLRFLLRQIGKLVRIATYLIVIGIIVVIGAGGLYLFQTLTQASG